MKKYLKKALLLLLALVISMALVNAEDPFKIKKVTIDDDTVTDNSIVSVERENSIKIKVSVEGIANTTDNRIKAWITGYRDKIEEVSRKFDLESGDTVSKTLDLEIPNDLEAKDYMLRIRLYNDDNYVEKSYKLRLKNFISIKDVSLSSSVVSAGTSIIASVDLGSSNYEKTQYATLQASIPTLRLNAITYLNDYELNDKTVSRDLVLKIPKTTSSGYYDLKITLKDSDGNELSEKEIVIKVDNAIKFDGEGKTLVSIATPGKALIGKEANIKVLITNLQESAETYSIEIDGEKGFAESKIEPQFITINPDKAGQVNIRLNIKENAGLGKKSFVVRVKAKEKIIEELTVSLDVNEVSESLNGKKNTIIIGSLIIIAIIIFFIIRTINNIRKEDERSLEGSKGPRYF